MNFDRRGSVLSMSAVNLTKSINSPAHIVLANDELNLPLHGGSTSYFYKIMANAPHGRIKCSIDRGNMVSIFFEIFEQKQNETQIEVILSDYSNLTLVCLIKSTQSGILDIKIRSLGKNSAADVRNIVLVENRDKCEIRTLQDHVASNSKSFVQNIAVIDEGAKLTIDGLINIGKSATDSQSFQHTKAILLSDLAHAEVTPKLKIQNNQVACNHGTAIGQFDEQGIYYMQTRGISEKYAKKLLIKGYVSSAFEGLEGKFWQKVTSDERFLSKI